MRIQAGVATVATLWISVGIVVGAEPTASQPVKPPADFDGLPLLLVEEFEPAAAERWEPTDTTAWKFMHDDHRSVYALIKRKSDYAPPHRSPLNISLLKGVYVSDFVLDVWIRSTIAPYGHQDMCVFFGHQSPTRFYYAHLGLESDPVSNILHIVNDKPRAPMAGTRTNGTPWRPDRYHHIRVRRDVRTGRIAVYFDDMDKPAMTAEDKTFGCGRVGVGSFDDIGNIDRLVLWGRKVEPRVTPPSRPAAAD